MLSSSRTRPLSNSPVQYRLLALLLSGLLLIVFDCVQLLHEPGQAHGPVRTVYGAQPGDEQVPRAEAPADSCSPAGSGVESAGRQSTRTPGLTAGAPEAAATHAAAPGKDFWPASTGLRTSTSGRLTLCSLCRWRT
ncbi:hypothetical protein [Streptomyces sp. NBC_01481]|uniref:hypothetical protein n=1 Tax=Streptomyces sp. NBC_01481 TaxID=2975869 RepID=UPI0022592252|nr:hypothetical protein [Streptomyces sp. NBC_01481]MCX4584065.1 hypothetical protein [Streptomyces sp. NBC_01481]